MRIEIRLTTLITAPSSWTSGRTGLGHREINADCLSDTSGLQDLSGDSVFFKDDEGQIVHTYSTYGRGGEQFLGANAYLDVTPKGRNENGPYHSLGDWVRPKNMYGKGDIVEGNGRYHAPGCACAVHK